MKLIFHCGEGKTGSSSIQLALYNSSLNLLKQGVLYYSTHKGGHFDFSYLVGERHRVPKDMDAVIINRVNATIDEIRTLASQSQPEFLILSSEGFFDYSKEKIETTIKALQLDITDIFCIVYVRCPNDFFLSASQQQLKGSYIMLNPLTFKRNIVKPLRTWKAFCGRANFHGSVYHKSVLPKGNVLADFKAKLEHICARKLAFAEQTHQNESLTAEQMILLQQFRRDFLPDHNGQFMPQSSSLIQLFTALNRLKNIQSKPRLTPALSKLIVNNNRDYISGADELLGGHLLSRLCDLSINSDAPKVDISHPVTDIKDILQSYDASAYCMLKNLIPQYSTNLDQAKSRLLSLFASAGASCRMADEHYRQYLQKC